MSERNCIACGKCCQHIGVPPESGDPNSTWWNALPEPWKTQINEARADGRHLRNEPCVCYAGPPTGCPLIAAGIAPHQCANYPANEIQEEECAAFRDDRHPAQIARTRELTEEERAFSAHLDEGWAL